MICSVSMYAGAILDVRESTHAGSNRANENSRNASDTKGPIDADDARDSRCLGTVEALGSVWIIGMICSLWMLGTVEAVEMLGTLVIARTLGTLGTVVALRQVGSARTLGIVGTTGTVSTV